MQQTLAFDVYGTLIDTQGVIDELSLMIGDRAQAFSQSWRDKQLEYSFRRGLMQRYQDFSVCTRQSLDYVDALFQTKLSDQQKALLLACYRTLPAFAETSDALSLLNRTNHQLYAFSNGNREAVETLLETTGIDTYFRDVISVDEIGTFKPDPAVYTHFLQRTNSVAEQSWLVSSNPFDVIGARSYGMKAAWIQRNPLQPFDPWDIEPTVQLDNLIDLYSLLNDQ